MATEYSKSNMKNNGDAGESIVKKVFKLKIDL